MNNEISNKPCGCGNCEPMCTTCGRPWVVCKGECGCKKPCCNKVNFCEYGRAVPGCIRERAPECPMQAVIPSVVVEDLSGLKNLADCFAHVSSINTTFYIDDKHRTTVTWAGPVEYDNYDLAANTLGLRSQFLIDRASNRGAYYDKTGAYQSFDFGDSDKTSLRLAFEVDMDLSSPTGVSVAQYSFFGDNSLHTLRASTGEYQVKITKITDVISGTVYYDISAGVDRLTDLYSDVAAADSVVFDIPDIGGELTFEGGAYSWVDSTSEVTKLVPFNQYTIAAEPGPIGGYGFWGFAGIDGEGLSAPFLWEVKVGEDQVDVGIGIHYANSL